MKSRESGHLYVASVTDKHSSCTFCTSRTPPVVALKSSDDMCNLVVNLCQRCLDIVRDTPLHTLGIISQPPAVLPIASAPAASILKVDAVYENQIVTHPNARFTFTRADLREAFNAVVFNLNNWKLPIDRVLVLQNPEREIACIKAAVEFFAGCVATVEYTNDSTQTTPRVRVTAIGYYAAVGA